MKFSDFLSVTFLKQEVDGETLKLEANKRPTSNDIEFSKLHKKFKYVFVNIFLTDINIIHRS